MNSVFTRLCLFFFGLSLSVSALAQDVTNSATAPELRIQHGLELGFAGLGYTVQVPTGRKFLFEATAGLGGGYDIGFSEFNYQWILNDPAVFVQLTEKWIYNRDRRAAKGKPMHLNAGNYVALRLKYASQSLGGNYYNWNALLGSLHWGIQRPLGQKWTFSTHAGVGYALDATDLGNGIGTVFPAFDLKFGRTFGR